jgi:hypothetical protein
MAPPKSRGATQSTNARILFFSILLAFQYGAQPLISKRFIRFFFLRSQIEILTFKRHFLVVHSK